MGVPYAPDMRMAISQQRVIRYTSSLVLGYGFQGQRIKWRYFWLHRIQDGDWPIQDGNRPPSWKILNGRK